jgi:exonuclease III
MDNKLKIVSFNAKGLKGQKKREKVLHWLSNKDADIILLQESHYNDQDKNAWKGIWKGDIYSSAGTSRSRGVTTLIRKSLPYKKLKEEKDLHGRWLLLSLEIDDVHYDIFNYYGPNLDETIHLEEMLNQVDMDNIGNTIIGGDFNFVYNLDIDKLGGNRTTNTKCRDKMINWQKANNLIDAWRDRNPSLQKFTWTSNNKPKIHCRLDHILIHESHLGHITDTSIKPGFISDHNLVSLTIQTRCHERGRGFWKFNSALLEDDNTLLKIVETITRTERENTPCSARTMWDMIKCNIRRTCIQIGVERKRKANLEEDRLTTLIDSIEESMVTKKKLKECVEQEEMNYEEAKHNLNQLLEDQCRGAAIRSRCSNYEHGDKATKYFLNMEKSIGKKNTIQQLVKEDGKLTTDQFEILEEELQYYQKLYSNHDIEFTKEIAMEKKVLWESKNETLDEDDFKELESDITSEEIWKIIKESPNNKSPGTDGYTNEFYKTLWPYINNYLMEAYKEAIKEGEMCTSQKRGIISLLPKEGKDTRELKNWRPLTLLNNDYKFLAKAISNRCKSVLPRLIGLDQNGFVPGRVIGSNIIRTLELIRLCEEQDMEGLLLNIDIEKAFDSVSWQFMYESLAFFQIPNKLINIIKCLYNNIEICTMNNGHSSKFVKVERGMRQGCPLSPILFVLTIELMNIYIKNKGNIKGLQCNKKEHLISQFADDTTFFLSNQKGNLDRLFMYLNNFGHMSGLKLNIGKSEILLLGKTTINDIPKNYANLVKDKVKTLGVDIYKDIHRTIEENYNKVEQKMTESIKFWNKKNLSLVGKINMVKNQITSKLIYIMTNLPSPEPSFWNRINKQLYNFIANNKQEKLRRKALINTYERGGAQMVDLESQDKALKAFWIVRASRAPGPWTDSLEEMMGTIDIREFAHYNLKKEDIPFKATGTCIWNQVLENWCDLNHRTPETIHDIAAEYLWMNSNIKIDGKVLWRNTWNETGIQQIDDLLDNTGSKLIGYRDFSRKFQINANFLEIGGLKKAIPGAWKAKLKDKGDIQINIDEAKHPLITKCNQANRGSKILYTKLIHQIAEGPGAKLQKWLEELNIDRSPEDILKGMVRTRTILKYSKLESFNYHFFHRNLIYGGKLFKMGKAPDDKCETCGIKETLLHLYWECPLSRKLWKSIEKHLPTCIPERITWNKDTCLLNVLPREEEKRNTASLIRTITTIVKYYIHRSRCNGEKRNPKALLNSINRVQKIEERIAQERPYGQKLKNKWKEWTSN